MVVFLDKEIKKIIFEYLLYGLEYSYIIDNVIRLLILDNEMFSLRW